MKPVNRVDTSTNSSSASARRGNAASSSSSGDGGKGGTGSGDGPSGGGVQGPPPATSLELRIGECSSLICRLPSCTIIYQQPTVRYPSTIVKSRTTNRARGFPGID